MVSRRWSGMTTESLYQDHFMNASGERRLPEYCGDLLDAFINAIDRIEDDFTQRWHVAVRTAQS
jgi:hypothetical protein